MIFILCPATRDHFLYNPLRILDPRVKIYSSVKLIEQGYSTIYCMGITIISIWRIYLNINMVIIYIMHITYNCAKGDTFLLETSKYTSNMAVLSDLRRFPISIILKRWALALNIGIMCPVVIHQMNYCSRHSYTNLLIIKSLHGSKI